MQNSSLKFKHMSFILLLHVICFSLLNINVETHSVRWIILFSWVSCSRLLYLPYQSNYVIKICHQFYNHCISSITCKFGDSFHYFSVLMVESSRWHQPGKIKTDYRKSHQLLRFRVGSKDAFQVKNNDVWTVLDHHLQRDCK